MTAAEVLDRLARSRTAAVTARAGEGARGLGTGAVTAAREGDVVVVSDAGEWSFDGRPPMRWRAVSRWRAEGDALAVEHVRQGTPAAATLDRGPDGRWLGREPHVCGDDRYAAALRVEPDAVVVTWTVSGPCKRAVVETRYA